MRRILTPDEAVAIQRALNLHVNARLIEDGHFGTLSQQALMRFQAERGIEPADGNPSQSTLDALGIPDLFEPPPSKPSTPSIPWLTLIGAAFNLAKGKTMTNDQFGGLVRAILTFLAGIVISKGWIDAGTAGQIVAGAVTVIVAGWSMWTNRAGKVVKS